MTWKAFQLNPDSSDVPTLKIDAYAKKFGRTRAEVLQMSEGMAANFARVGLPHAFTEKALISSTVDGHRVLAWCAADGPEAQDRAMERLFSGYFAEERAPNDVEVLVEACVAAGKAEADARRFVADKGACRAEVDAELADARRRRVSGVPHFLVAPEGGRATSLSGAQPPEAFLRAFAA